MKSFARQVFNTELSSNTYHVTGDSTKLGLLRYVNTDSPSAIIVTPSV
jgi:hypothetical protein